MKFFAARHISLPARFIRRAFTLIELMVVLAIIVDAVLSHLHDADAL